MHALFTLYSRLKGIFYPKDDFFQYVMPCVSAVAYRQTQSLSIRIVWNVERSVHLYVDLFMIMTDVAWSPETSAQFYPYVRQILKRISRRIGWKALTLALLAWGVSTKLSKLQSLPLLFPAKSAWERYFHSDGQLADGRHFPQLLFFFSLCVWKISLVFSPYSDISEVSSAIPSNGFVSM
jgi:hypothetical protein